MFKNRKIPHWIFLYVVAILLVAGAVNGLMYLSVPTLPVLDAKTWLGFWGSYLGGAIGCVPALLALYDNRREARRQHEESERSRRLAALPVIDCKCNYSSLLLGESKQFSEISCIIFLDESVGLHDQAFYNNPKDCLNDAVELDASFSRTFLEFRNIGSGPALNLSLFCKNIVTSEKKPLYTLGVGDACTIVLCVHIPPEARDDYITQYNLEIEFSDTFGNCYTQMQLIECKKEKFTIPSISVPELKINKNN